MLCRLMTPDIRSTPLGQNGALKKSTAESRAKDRIFPPDREGAAEPDETFSKVHPGSFSDLAELSEHEADG